MTTSLTPVGAGTVTPEDGTEVTWPLSTDGGSPVFKLEGNTGYYVQQATIAAKAIDVAMLIDTRDNAGIESKRGKVDIQSNRAQVNAGTVFNIPAIAGMTVEITATNGTPAVDHYTFNGDNASSVNTGAKTYTYTYEGSESTLKIVAVDGSTYPSKIVVTYPAAAPAATELANLSELKSYTPAGDDPEDVLLTLTDAKVTFIATVYDSWEEVDVDKVVLEDASAAYMIEGSGLGKLVSVGQTLNGKLALTLTPSWTGVSVALSNGITGVTAAAGEASPLVLTADNVDDYAADFDWRYVTIPDATFSIVSGGYGDDYYISSELLGDAVGMMDSFGILDESDYPADGTKARVTGFMYDYMGYMTIFQPVSIEVIPESVSVTVGTAGYATFSSDKALDFTSSAIKAYTATVSGSDITFARINKVPANTGMLLYADGGATEDIPVADAADDATGNAFVVAATAMNGAALQAEGAYILANGTNGIGFYKAGASASLAAGKAYLVAPAGARIVMPDGAVTGIQTVEAAETEAPVFNLQGQRVAAPKKGLVIKNGKKIVVK